MKSTKCIACGNDTLQGTLCAVCTAGIPQIQEELIALLKEGKYLHVLKTLKLPSQSKNNLTDVRMRDYQGSRVKRGYLRIKAIA